MVDFIEDQFTRVVGVNWSNGWGGNLYDISGDIHVEQDKRLYQFPTGRSNPLYLSESELPDASLSAAQFQSDAASFTMPALTYDPVAVGQTVTLNDVYTNGSFIISYAEYRSEPSEAYSITITHYRLLSDSSKKLVRIFFNMAVSGGSPDQTYNDIFNTIIVAPYQRKPLFYIG